MYGSSRSVYQQNSRIDRKQVNNGDVNEGAVLELG